MGISISGTYTSSFSLYNGATQNPATVTPSGLIDVNSSTAFTNGITGAGGFAWTVTNLGTVESVGSYGVGISLAAGGSVTNGATGSTAGYIRGSVIGVQISGAGSAVGTVNNYGTIKSISDYLFGNAIVANGIAIGVLNTGLIFSQNTAGAAANGIQLGIGGVVVNRGVIEGLSNGTNQSGIVAFSGNTTIISSGTIEAPGSSGTGVNITAGSINNSGLITGAGQGISIGIGTAGGAGTITNAGMISQTGNAGAQAIALGGTAGNNRLENSGTISAAGANANGVLVGSGGASITNGGFGTTQGLISAYHTAIGFFPGTATGSGVLTITNYGAIRSVQTGVGAGSAFAINTGVGSTTIIDNFGVIGSAQTNGGGAILLSGGKIINEAGAVIASTAGAGISNTGAPITVTNFGTIAGGGGVGIGINLQPGSTVINAGMITGNGGIAVAFSGGSGNRLILDPGAGFQGTVANANGTIELAVGNGAAATLPGFSATFKNFLTLQFDTGAQWTVEDAAGGFPASIIGFDASAALVVDNFAAVSDTYTGSGLVLTDASNNQVTLGIQGSFVTRNFIIASANGGSGTRITLSTSSNIAPADFNADGRSDVLLHNTGSGSFVAWDMDGSIIASAGNLTAGGSPVALDPSWSVGGIGDFNGDGNADILLHSTAGAFVDWTMNGTTISAAQNVTFNGSAVALDPSWSVAGVGDLNGDGKADILLHSTAGAFVDWTMGGSAITAADNITFNGAPVSLDPSWSVAGLGDFNGDGKADILLKNTDGSFVDWSMNGAAITAAQNLTSQGANVALDSSWSVLGTGDFDGDGKSDILLHNTNGSFVDWTMNGSAIASAADLVFQGNPVTLDSSWSFADIGDYNGDGKSDILLRNSNGSFADWTMNGATITAAQYLTSQGAAVMLDSTWHT